MITFLAMGVIFGLSAGLSPGPLLTLVFSETLQNGIKSGVKIAVAPLITDLPIVLLAILVIEELARFDLILGIISLLGGITLLYLGYENIRITSLCIETSNFKSRSLMKGIVVNFLSPHPYLFWFSVGAPMTVKAFKINFLSAFAFIFGFYLLLVGSKIVITILVAKTKTFLSSKLYVYIMKLLGIALFIFAGCLFYNALKLMRIL